MGKDKKELIKMDILPIEKFNYTKFSEENSVVFTGSPVKHPYENDKFILISDPLSANTDFIEFKKEDLIFVEDLPSLISDKGESIQMVKVYIKKGAIAVRYKPFVVGE